MLTSVTQSSLYSWLRQQYPNWTEEYTTKLAEKCTQTMHELLDEPLARHMSDGSQPDVAADGMTLHTILAFRPGIRYFDALLLMDGYLKDKKSGMARILQPSGR